MIQVTLELSHERALASSPIGFGSSRAWSAIQCGTIRSYPLITATHSGRCENTISCSSDQDSPAASLVARAPGLVVAVVTGAMILHRLDL